MTAERARVTFDPSSTEIDAAIGKTLLDVAHDHEVGIESLCGGKGLCGTCEVAIESGASSIAPPTDADRFLIEEAALAAGRRLSCRCTIEAAGAIDVFVPPKSRETGAIVLTEGRSMDVALRPAVEQYHVRLAVPTVEQNVADRERLIAGLADGYGLEIDALDFGVQRHLPAVLRAGERDGRLEVTATVYRDREVIDVTAGPPGPVYGLAVDVGTTTLAVYLTDLQTGDVVAVASGLNPQTAMGEDIMTRMRHCRREVSGRSELQDAVLEGVNDLIGAVCADAEVTSEAIYEAVFVGNTAMHHLFLGIDPNAVAGSPYIPANRAAITLKARELDLDINTGGYLYWLPVSGGWVGPDKVAVMLAAGHHRDDALTVCIDIGTNGEISVGNADRMWTTSAPAGPALEGGELTHGVRAQSGAIEHVSIDVDRREPEVSTIDDLPPIGICGSGVIDALAECFRVGIVDRRGTLQDGHPRVRTNDDGEREFVLVDADAAATDHDIVLTQNDVRDVQMAKAAIQAGTLVLLEELKIDSVDRVIVAGAFGNFIDPMSARLIGLYPDVDPGRIERLGNGAGVGAQLALLDVATRDEATNVVDLVEYFEIAGTDRFQDQFLASMYLPHQRFDRYPDVEAAIREVREPIDVERPVG